MGTIARFDFKALIPKFGLRHFVETGTGMGDSLTLASSFNFDTMYSCEIEPNLAKRASVLFESRSNVRIYNMKSLDFLQRLCDEISKDEPILFWLDAHFPGVDYKIRRLDETTDSAVMLPLENELTTIMASRSKSRDVILIDDLRIYKDCVFGDGSLPGDLRPVCPADRNIDFVHKLCGSTHDVQELYADQGYIVLTPKNPATAYSGASIARKRSAPHNNQPPPGVRKEGGKMVDPIAREAEAVEPIASTIGKINGGLAQTILDLQSIALDLQRFAAGHADTGPAFGKAIALQSAAVALQKHALHLREMIDPVRSVLRPERFYQAGVVAAADERFAVAAGFFRRALELCAEYPEAHKGLGDVLRKQGAHEDAIEQYRQAADAHARLAHSLEAQGKLAAAMHELWTAGVVFMEQGFNDEAADTFRKAIRLDPRNAKAQAYLGSAFYRKQDWDAAEAAFRTAINLDPTCADAYSDLALTLIHLNRHDESSSLLSTSTAINLDHGIDLGDAVQVPVYRIKHDREQIDLLRQRGLLDKKWEIYADYLNTLWQDSRTRADSGAPMTVVGADVHKIAPSYNRIVYLPESPAIPGGALRPDLSVEAIQSGYTHSVPGIVWMDNFLTEEALLSLRQFCNEATVWKGQYAGGYVGAILKRGFSSPLILQIAEEIRTRFPAIFASHHLEQVWGFKYDSTMRGTGVHADFAAVNVNFWITPDEACRDPDNSGLMIWDKGPPKGWSFGEYNDVASEKEIRRFLADASAHSIRIPYRSNRCIIFDSTLFHETDRFSFVDAYELRRVNITLLYGVGLRTR